MIVLQRVTETHLYSLAQSYLTVMQGTTVPLCSTLLYAGKGGGGGGSYWRGCLLISVPDFPRGLLLGYESRRDVGTVLANLNNVRNSQVFVSNKKFWEELIAYFP
jgi:hypothetical protein